MKMGNVILFITVTALFWISNSEPSTTIKHQIQSFEDYVNASLTLDKHDKILLSNWTQDLQVKMVNVTAKYRAQVTRHKERSFRKANEKWKECMKLHRKEIRTSEKHYYENESKCLNVANSADNQKIKAVTQVEKEIRKWRKSYRYLRSLCTKNHPGDQEQSDVCLVEYMLSDNYHLTFQRLIVLKLKSMQELFIEMNTTVILLGDCLKTNFSSYLENVRKIMETLHKCYRGANV